MQYEKPTIKTRVDMQANEYECNTYHREHVLYQYVLHVKKNKAQERNYCICKALFDKAIRRRKHCLPVEIYEQVFTTTEQKGSPIRQHRATGIMKPTVTSSVNAH